VRDGSAANLLPDGGEDRPAGRGGHPVAPGGSAGDVDQPIPVGGLPGAGSKVRGEEAGLPRGSVQHLGRSFLGAAVSSTAIV
jgi:hypothetical protein